MHLDLSVTTFPECVNPGFPEFTRERGAHGRWNGSTLRREDREPLARLAPHRPGAALRLPRHALAAALTHGVNVQYSPGTQKVNVHYHA